MCEMREYEITVRGTVITLIITLPGKTRHRRSCADENRKFALLVSHLHASARWLFRISSAQIGASFLPSDALLGIRDLIRDRDRYRSAIK